MCTGLTGFPLLPSLPVPSPSPPPPLSSPLSSPKVLDVSGAGTVYNSSAYKALEAGTGAPKAMVGTTALLVVVM